MRRPHLITVLAFILFVFGLTAVDLSNPPAQVSTSERRKLAQFPGVSLQSMLDGRFAQDYSAFLQDQVVFRDAFRRLKSFVERRLWLKRENNGVYVLNNNLYDKFYGVNERYIQRAATLMNGIIASINSPRIYLSVIPSKAHLLDGSDYLLSDQNAIADYLRQNVQATYIDLMNAFAEGDDHLFYVTDHHWTTHGAIRGYKVLMRAMGLEPVEGYHFEQVTDSFAGSLYGRAAVGSIARDRIHLAHNPVLDHLTTCRYQTMEDVECFDSVYFRDNAAGLDPYDVFIGGAAPITVVENDQAASDDELVIFKDSYAHSLVPFPAQHFRTVTLFDLRYVMKELIFDQFDLDGKTVLFLYSTTILNTDPRILN
jgi:hypothetical protein